MMQVSHSFLYSRREETGSSWVPDSNEVSFIRQTHLWKTALNQEKPTAGGWQRTSGCEELQDVLHCSLMHINTHDRQADLKPKSSLFQNKHDENLT